jgi:hypothetical protein
MEHKAHLLMTWGVPGTLLGALSCREGAAVSCGEQAGGWHHQVSGGLRQAEEAVAGKGCVPSPKIVIRCSGWQEVGSP